MMSATFTPHATLTLGRLLAGMAALGLAGIAGAQTNRWAKLQPVDAGFGDMGPLRASTRLMPVDMRSPSGFDRVFRVPGSAGGVGAMSASDDRFARVSGGLSAVFPRSEYLSTKKGMFAAIPAGTVFYIGGIPEAHQPMGGGPNPTAIRGGLFSLAASGAVATRALAAGASETDIGYMNLRVPDAGAPEAERERVVLRRDASAPPSNVLADDWYRRARMRQLLVAAAHSD